MDLEPGQRLAEHVAVHEGALRTGRRPEIEQPRLHSPQVEKFTMTQKRVLALANTANGVESILGLLPI